MNRENHINKDIIWPDLIPTPDYLRSRFKAMTQEEKKDFLDEIIYRDFEALRLEIFDSFEEIEKKYEKMESNINYKFKEIHDHLLGARRESNSNFNWLFCALLVVAIILHYIFK